MTSSLYLCPSRPVPAIVFPPLTWCCGIFFRAQHRQVAAPSMALDCECLRPTLGKSGDTSPCYGPGYSARKRGMADFALWSLEGENTSVNLASTRTGVHWLWFGIVDFFRNQLLYCSFPNRMPIKITDLTHSGPLSNVFTWCNNTGKNCSIDYYITWLWKLTIIEYVCPPRRT